MDVIGMTNLQEAKLAREAEICYATIALVTDYDCWHPDHDSVTVDMVIGNLLRFVEKVRYVFGAFVRRRNLTDRHRRFVLFRVVRQFGDAFFLRFELGVQGIALSGEQTGRSFCLSSGLPQLHLLLVQHKPLLHAVDYAELLRRWRCRGNRRITSF